VSIADDVAFLECYSGERFMTAHSDEPAARAAFDKRAILQNHALFGALGSGVIDQLSAHAASKRIKRGTTIFSKGDQGTCLYAVCSGQVKDNVPNLSHFRE
jgi:hypothetical protein